MAVSTDTQEADFWATHNDKVEAKRKQKAQERLAQIEEDRPFNTAISILKELRKGKTFLLSSGHTLGMSEDCQIGYVLTNESTGESFIGTLCEVTLADIVKYCKENNVLIVPSGDGIRL